MLKYNEYGDSKNPTILLLHGAGAYDTFSGQYGFAEKYHLIVPHLPGAGKAADVVYEPEKTKQELYELIHSLGKEKIGVVGHSLGAQVAVMLVSAWPELFQFAVFLSAWVNPEPDTVNKYCRLATVSAKMLHIGWLTRFQGKYWNYTKEQADYLVEYSKKITPRIYRSFFENTLDLSKLPSYGKVCVPMYAICGDKEVKDMKISLKLLADFPMRNAKELNKILADIFSSHTIS